MIENHTQKENKGSLPVWARIVLILFAFFIVGGLFQLIGFILADVSVTDMQELKDINTNQKLILQLFTFSPVLLIVYYFRKFVDNESIMSIGFSFKGRSRDIIAGLAAAFTILGGGSLLLNLLGYINFLNIQIDGKSLALYFVIFIMVAISEEVLFRGYILNNLLSVMNKYLALLISAAIFALLHILNFDLTFIAFINLILAGLLLGATYIYTKNLWFPISLHLFWNFFQGPVLGYSVSGNTTSSVFTLESFGNINMNGGEFGFEGSMICSILNIVAILLIIGYFHKKNMAAK